MIEIKNFKERKDKGLLSLQMAGKLLVLTHKQFDSQTGEEIQELSMPIEAEVVRTKLEEAKRQVQSLQEMVDEIDKVEAEAKLKEEKEKKNKAA